MGGYNVEFPKAPVRAPKLDGYVTHMTASLVDRRGPPITIRDVMLHHFVFHRNGQRPELGPCTSRRGEAIYGTGEEQEDLRLPGGYGYRVRTADKWRITAMLMSHSERSIDAYIRYKVTVVTGRTMKSVEPFWVRANGCGPQVSYPVLGGGGPGSTNHRSYDWKVPFDGRIVAVGGHLHGGAQDMWMSQPRCENRRILDNSPALRDARPPLLHGPPDPPRAGPLRHPLLHVAAGHPGAQGRAIRLNATYDNSRPASACHGDLARLRRARRHDPEGLHRAARGRRPHHQAEALPGRRRRRSRCRLNRITLRRAHRDLHARPGRRQAGQGPAAPWTCATTCSGPRTSRCRLGGSLRWRFADAIPHNVLFASGPRLVGSPTL